MRPYRFPRDAKILREDAVIFHRDRFQDLIPRPEGRARMLHCGDLGDCVASLPILRSLGGGSIVITDNHTTAPGHSPRETMRGARYDAIAPLLAEQSYVDSVEWQDEPTGITHDLSGFRTIPRGPTENLAEWQAHFLEIEISLDPWLEITGAQPNGFVVMARSQRYHNLFFPWAKLVNKYRTAAIFVGLPDEHAAFERVVRSRVAYRPTADLLEVAQLIAGAKLFIGNQSAAYWIAAGLGVPTVQESWNNELNSIVQRANALYTATPPETRTLMHRL